MSSRSGQRPVVVIPVTLPVANSYVEQLHRHHAPIPAGFVWFCIAAIVDGTCRGVAISGRPTNRNNDDRQTIEVLRVAADGTPNVPSALLGSAAKAARALGASRIITYTLESETGASLRGAGWRQEASGITSSWMKGTSRRTAVDRPHMQEKKVRWAVNFRPLVPAEFSVPPSELQGQESLLDLLGGEGA